MGLKDTDFIDISGLLRVQEKRLLTTASIDRVLDSGGMQETLRMLSQNSDYDFASLARPEDYEGVLKEELRRVYAQAYSLSKSREVVDIPAAKYEYHNLKAALKARYFPQRSPVPYILVGGPEAGVYEALAAGDEKAEAPAHLKSAAAAARQAFERDGNPQSIDVVLDRRLYARMLELCETLENPFITGYVQQSIDFYNLKTLLRVKGMQRGTAFLSECLVDGGLTAPSFFMEHYNKTPAAMVPVFYYRHFGDAMRQGMEAYEKSGNLAGLEKLLDNCMIEYTRQAKYVAFGAEILFAYLLSKENEIRQIRIIMTCKANAIPSDALRERLRENYA